MRKRVVVALGGNAILQRGQKGTYEEQMENVRKTAKQIVDIILLNSLITACWIIYPIWP